MKQEQEAIRWLPWGNLTLGKAREGNKPVYLYIRMPHHDACEGWERECFEDADIVSFVNEHFVPIRLDHNQKPEVEQFYTAALFAMTGAHGWPLNLFLTPNGDPFYGGIEFPKEDRGDIAGFLKVLRTVASLWAQDEEILTLQSRHLSQHVKAELARESS
ncbi:MAG: DUF255 domain-containing protein [Deltaproteobacteria bacterium]|nr:DUF255 domain-containing protein [Deltaproteobacteria bacterium]